MKRIISKLVSKDKAGCETSSPYDVEEVDVDVLIIGTGPVGSAYARTLIDSNKDATILHIDTGAQLSKIPGQNQKNTFFFQRNIDPFTHIVQGHVVPLSVPTSSTFVPKEDPASFTYDPKKYPGFVQNNQNPEQVERENLVDAGVCYAVGGMGTHWTCAIPRTHPKWERNDLFSAQEWDEMYAVGEKLLNQHTDIFTSSIRQNVVIDALKNEYKELTNPKDQPQPLPLSGERSKVNPEVVNWGGADTVLGDLATSPQKYADRYQMREQHRCREFKLRGDGSIEYAIVEDLINWRTIKVRANAYVASCGTVLNGQLLFNSGIRPKALGHYLVEQPLAFCQVSLLQSLVDHAVKNPKYQKEIEEHQRKHPNDPIPFPITDPDPQAWIPVSDNRPWHCQVHRDAFAFGGLSQNVDSRLIVDFRWFGLPKEIPGSYVYFSEKVKDMYGLPQPTFHWEQPLEDRARQHDVMEDMLRAASAVGGFLPSSLPQWMPSGQSLHIHGVNRMGAKDDGTSVVDRDLKVWGHKNLYLGGNGTIPVGIACNPTLTSVSLAARAAKKIAKLL